MVASNVPTTILIILRFLVTLKSVEAVDICTEVAFQLPDLAFCLFELVALILMPAKLYEMVQT
jgi:hypothetical protein